MALSNSEVKQRSTEAARRLTELYSCRKPPFPIDPLLEYYAVRSVRERVFEYDARLSLDGGQLSIEVNSAFPRVRRRLSVAHEIAHLILRECGGEESTDHHNPHKESLCNQLAGQLLAPDWAIRSHFEDFSGLGQWQERIRCSTLLGAAGIFDVSVDVMARRVFLDLNLAPQMIAVVWRYRENTSTVDSDRALRVSSVWHSLGDKFFIPLNKTVAAESVISKAYDHDGVFLREEAVHLGRLKGWLTIEALGFPWFPVRQAGPPSRAVLSILRMPAS